ncbi:FadR/GntR family transcriptional regulator, partial [Mycobacterium avium]
MSIDGRPAERPVERAAEVIAGQIRRRIIRGELGEGEALPTENELLIQFGVSRPTLREAIRVLESESLIEVKRGSRGGIRVSVPRVEIAAHYTGLMLEYR